jgi:Protein of unknown function (DUF4230)
VATKRAVRVVGGGGAGFAVKLVGVVVALVVLAALAIWISPLDLPNPFGETHKERPNSVVLAELRNQSRYVAASARFQTVIDSEEDADYLPDFLKGSHEVFIAEGDVEGSVEFGGLGDDAMKVSDDGKSVTVHVPPPELSKPRIDPNATRLVSRDRGLLDRAAEALGNGDPSNQQALNQRAEQKVADAADQSELRQRARENTEKFLQSFLKAVGFEQVTVVFDGTAPAPPTPQP